MVFHHNNRNPEAEKVLQSTALKHSERAVGGYGGTEALGLPRV